MPDRSFLGIDHNDHGEWVLALMTEGKIEILQTFENTQAGLLGLVRFIGEHCQRPKICLNPTNRAALKLLKCIGAIPGVEVVLLSAAGLRLHRAWLGPVGSTLSVPADIGQAVMLAHCAARMI